LWYDGIYIGKLPSC